MPPPRPSPEHDRRVARLAAVALAPAVAYLALLGLHRGLGWMPPDWLWHPGRGYGFPTPVLLVLLLVLPLLSMVGGVRLWRRKSHLALARTIAVVGILIPLVSLLTRA